MSSSFTVIFALMVALSHERTVAKRSKRPPTRVRERPNLEIAPSPVLRRRNTTASCEQVSKVTVLADSVSELIGDIAPPLDTAWEVRQRKLEKELDKLRVDREDLSRQLTVLEQDRGRMVTELAKELSTSEPLVAAAELVLLDDEAAALVLKNMSNDPRIEVLSLLEPKLARRLKGRLKRL